MYRVYSFHDLEFTRFEGWEHIARISLFTDEINGTDRKLLTSASFYPLFLEKLMQAWTVVAREIAKDRHHVRKKGLLFILIGGMLHLNWKEHKERGYIKLWRITM